MKNTSEIITIAFVFGFGFIIGIICTATLFIYYPNTILQQVSVMKQECEKSLPRDQQCVIKMVPKS